MYLINVYLIPVYCSLFKSLDCNRQVMTFITYPVCSEHVGTATWSEIWLQSNELFFCQKINPDGRLKKINASFPLNIIYQSPYHAL